MSRENTQINQPPMTFEEFLQKAEKSFGPLSDTQVRQYRQLEELYLDWNSKINVVSRKDIGQLYSHHVLHSLAIAEYIRISLPDLYGSLRDPEGGTGILDIGTGGGFPGIPLAILFPGGRFTLCDSIGKKIKVASAVAGALGLGNTVTVNARAEDIPGQYDYIVSRAVTSLDKFIPWTRGKVSRGIFYLKGGDLAEELGVTMQKYRIKPGSVYTWKVDSWLEDEYFSGKMVVFMKK